jgi:kumamolisin
VTGIFGLDNRRVSKRPGGRIVPVQESMTAPPVQPGTRVPKAFRELYHFPQKATGKGQNIALLEFGGGFERRKLNSYLTQIGVSAPKIVVHNVGAGSNRPSPQPGKLSPDAEVYMDLEILASVAPDATIVVYFAENNSRGWLEALHAAIFNRRYPPSVLSISWGQAEQYWEESAIHAVDELLHLAAELGVSVCCSSGDRGVFEADGVPYTIPFPASSVYSLSCGGTQIEVLGSNRISERVWNQSKDGVASGGGVSRVFGLPEFQRGARVPYRFGTRQRGRGIPDVAANASSLSGYLIIADGTCMSLGGTSAATPLWAGLIACLNEELGQSLGYLTPLLYSGKLNAGLQRVTYGNNRLSNGPGYKARKNWDPCTGLGTPNGEKLLERLRLELKRQRSAPGK